MERWRRGFGSTWTGLTLTTLAVLSAAMLGLTHGVARVLWSVVGLIAALVLFVANRAHEAERAARDTEVEDLAEAARVTAHGAIASAVVPLLRLVNQIHEEPDPHARSSLRRQAVTGVLNSCTAVCGPLGEVRACWYALDVHADGRVLGLRFDEYAGRPDEPRVRFDASTATGRQVLDSLLADEQVFVADLRVTRPPAWDPSDVASGHYVSFLAVPVRGEHQVHGMLTIDARHGGVLTAERDEPLITLLARVLAAALAERFEEDVG